MERKLTNYQVTPETAGYLETLRALETLKNCFISALNEHYGDIQGERLYNDELPKFDALGAVFSEYLTISITENFGNLNEPKNVI